MLASFLNDTIRPQALEIFSDKNELQILLLAGVTQNFKKGVGNCYCKSRHKTPPRSSEGSVSDDERVMFPLFVISCPLSVISYLLSVTSKVNLNFPEKFPPKSSRYSNINTPNFAN